MKKRNYFGLAVLEEFEIKNKTIKEFFSNKYVCHINHRFGNVAGYGWVFPKKNSVNIGIVDYQKIGEKSKNYTLKRVFKKYLLKLQEINTIPKNLTSRQIKGGLLPFQPIQKTYSNHVLLSGDAAGFINPLTGEGIYYALSSGEIAADISSKAINNNETSEILLYKY